MRERYPKGPEFIWNGQNLLLQLIKSFNFLSKSVALADCYGADFCFLNNPFLRAVPLKDRPVTPRCTERTVFINGQSTTEISESLRKERVREIEAMTLANRVIEDGASWWPEARYSFALKKTNP